MRTASNSNTHPCSHPEYELKFLVSHSRAARFLWECSSGIRPLIYDHKRPVAYTRSTYLDTLDLHYLKSSESQSKRHLRVREYASAVRLGAPPAPTGACFLELKERTNSQRSKWRAPVQLEEVRAELTTGNMRTLMPTLSISYRRESYVDHSRQVRLTVDSEITVQNASLAGGPLVETGMRPFGAQSILEIKTRMPLDPMIARAIRSLGCVPTEVSKYETAMRFAGLAESRARPTEAGLPLSSSNC